MALAPWRSGRFCSTAAKRCCAGSATANPFSVLLLDIDHSKAVNDQHGHLVEDWVLAEFARPALDRPHWPLWRRGIRGAAGGDRGSRHPPGQTRFDELLARADAALYQAKDQGRNATVAA